MREIKKPSDAVPHKFEEIDGWQETLREIQYFTKNEVGQIIDRVLFAPPEEQMKWRALSAVFRGVDKGKTLAEILFPDPVPVNKSGMTVSEMFDHMRIPE